MEISQPTDFGPDVDIPNSPESNVFYSSPAEPAKQTASLTFPSLPDVPSDPELKLEIYSYKVKGLAQNGYQALKDKEILTPNLNQTNVDRFREYLTLNKIEPESISIEPASLKLSGEKTKSIGDKLKSMGGRWNPTLKGWIFSYNKFDEIKKFIESVPRTTTTTTSGKKTRVPVKRVKETTPTLPSIEEETQEIQEIPSVLTYQTVSFSVIRPQVGMNVLIKLGTNQLNYHVTDVERDSHDHVVSALIKPNRGEPKTSKLVICSGQWQVLGLIQSHVVNFL